MAKVSLEETAKQMERVNKVLADPKTKDMSPLERIEYLCDTLGYTDEERREMKQSMVAGLAAWKEASEGVKCECGEVAIWQRKKTATKIVVDDENLAFDVFHFKCSGCGKEIDRRWRAPTLDDKTFESYSTTY